MNTTDVFKPQPMSSYDSISQPKPNMNNIQGVSLQSIQERVIPRQVSTGSNRGEMTVKGLIRIVDTDSSVKMIMGFKPGAF
jgi:hypothetical protein